jgi:hypothetical protein
MIHSINRLPYSRITARLLQMLVCLPLMVGQYALADTAAKTLVTDAQTLRAMGFPAQAQNVYISNEVLNQANNTYFSTDFETLDTPTTGIDYNGISAKEFIGRSNSTGTSWTYTTSGSDLSRNGVENFADAQFDIPTGATLRYFRWWASDASVNNGIAFFLFEQCQPSFGAGSITSTTLVSTTTSGSGGNQSQSVFLNDLLVNNRDCVYLARVRFDETGSALRLQKVRMEFFR